MTYNLICKVINKMLSLVRAVINIVYYYINIIMLKNGCGARFFSKNAYIILKEWDYRYKKTYSQAINYGFRVATRNNMLQYKKSDRLYVLGSGPSINNISDEQWKTIFQNDSFGFNYFFVHPFIPTYYHMELSNRNAFLFKECYQEKPVFFKDIPIVLNMLNLTLMKAHKKDFDYINNLYVSVPKTFSWADNTQLLQEVLRYEYFSRDYCENNLLVHYRASLFLIISIGVLLGYREIVLAGVDMFKMDYFYYDETIYNDSIAKKVREVNINSVKKFRDSGKSSSKLHRVADPNVTRSIALDKAVVIMNEEVLKPKNIKLYLLSSESLLYPRIGVLSK